MTPKSQEVENTGREAWNTNECTSIRMLRFVLQSEEDSVYNAILGVDEAEWTRRRDERCRELRESIALLVNHYYKK